LPPGTQESMHVHIRAFQAHDHKALHRWMNDPSVVAGLVGARSAAFSLEQAKNWVEAAMVLEGPDRKWAICRRDAPEALGFTALYGLGGGAAPQFAIVVGEQAARGQGIGQAATALTLELAFGELDQRRVYLEVLASNLAAIGLYERLGFRLEGRLRGQVSRNGHHQDLLIYGLLRDEWTPRSS
jgi:diamine N-acetyltransferase